jgi:zinc D-Ala-D-Ala carboxypeptidase
MMDYKILVNKETGLPSNYVPKDLVNVGSLYKKGILLNEKVKEQWLRLKKEVARKGYCIEIESGYRSFDYQQSILNNLIEEKGNEYAKKAIAKPGHSEHQTGLAIDYCIHREGLFLTEQDIDLTQENVYTNSIAHLYGFIIRYPKGKEDITGYMYEPWHLRYVGKKLATYIHEKNITLDEYYKED